MIFYFPMELAFVRPSVRFLFCIMNHPPHPIVYPETNAITNNIEYISVWSAPPAQWKSEE